MAAPRNNLPTDLAVHVAAFFSTRLTRGGRVCVGLSGGRDSVALLHALVRARDDLPGLRLSAMHVHHGLSPHADAWADACADLCRRFDVPFLCRRIAVVDSGEGLEAAARRARYEAFAAALTAHADWLALAHHRDDQGETLLLNLLRGAGADGLAAMPEERPLTPEGQLRLVRPFLTVARPEIEHWLARQGLTWVEDESNFDRRFRRNFLRHEILPALAQAFPDPTAALARSAGHLAECAALAGELAALDLTSVGEGGGLRVDAFNRLSAGRRANLLRHFLRTEGVRMPDGRHLAEMLRQIADAAQDAQPNLVLDGGGTLRIHRGLLLYCSALPQPPVSMPWRGEAALAWAGGTLCFEAATGAGIGRQYVDAAPVEVRRREGGEHLQLATGRPRRALKKLLQEAGMPAWQRQVIPLLFCGGELAWVAGIGVDARFLAADGEAGVLPIWSGATGG